MKTGGDLPPPLENLRFHTASATSGRSLVIAAILNAQFAYAESADMQALQRPRIDAKGVAAATSKHIH